MASYTKQPLHERYAPAGLRPHTRALDREKQRARKKWKRRAEQDRPMGAKVKHKTTYRVRAHDERGLLTFFKTRTKLQVSTLKRLLARGHLTADRITI